MPEKPRIAAAKPSELTPDDLVQYGLPMDYGRLTVDGRLKARMSVFTSWFNLKTPHILCTDTEGYLRSHRLFVDYYLKGAEMNDGLYHFEDPLHKYDMLRMAMSPAEIPSEPSKSVLHAPRGSAKTVTLCFERYLMIGIVRPGTLMVMSEINSTRTKEEINRIRSQIEENPRLHRDFGESGELWPTKARGTKKWTDERMEIPMSRTTIFGVSCLSAHRGRHPILGTIDDPEDPVKLREKGFRAKYFMWLHRTYMPMFKVGSVVTQIATICQEGSCTDLMLRGRSVENPDDADADDDYDPKFDDWRKERLQLVKDDEDGERISVWPEYISVEGFDIKLKQNPAATMAEYQGMPIADGEFIFDRDDFRHGYSRCRGKDGEDYFVDLQTGETKPWDDFVDGLVIYGAGDLADSLAPGANPSALVFVGVDEDRVHYVLDCWVRRIHADKLIPKAYEIAGAWKAKVMAWETGTMQRVVKRMADRYRQMLISEGKHAPKNVGVSNVRKNKVERIIAGLSAMMANGELKFPFFDKTEEHDPIKNKHKRFHAVLRHQIDTFTDEGSIVDDAIDALEMACRVAQKAKGRHITHDPLRKLKKSYAEWEDAGMPLERHCIPTDVWKPEWIEEALKPHNTEEYTRDEVDPYEDS